MVKNLLANAGDARYTGLIHGLERSSQLKWQPVPVFFPGKFQGQRSLVSYEVHEVEKSQT